MAGIRTRSRRVQHDESSDSDDSHRDERNVDRHEEDEEDPEDHEEPEDPPVDLPDDQGYSEESGDEPGDLSEESGEEEEDDGEGPGALTPALDIAGTLRYRTNKTHYYLWKSGTKSLEDELFDCTPDTFFQMIKSLEERANEMGWTKEDGILWVRRKGGELINLLEGYGSISLKRIQRHERTYWNNGYRKSQDDRMLYECIMNSLSPDGKQKINVHKNEYHLKDGNKRIPSGLCLFKVLVRESYLDSNATTSMIRQQLAKLHEYMESVGNDVIKFNNHVKMLLTALHARNESTLDLLTYLFEAYAICKDKEFNKFIRDLQTDHDMGTRKLDDMELMALAEKKYKIMKTLNKWEAPTLEDEKLLALQAKLEKVQDKLNKVGQRRKRLKEEEDGSKKRKKIDKSKKKPDWFNHSPKPGKEHETREWNGAIWYYCCEKTGGKCGGMWRTHPPKKCRGIGKKQGNDDKKSRKRKVPKVEIKEALDDDSSSDEESDLMGGYMSE